ncbi:hypothetical protein OAE40_00580 [Rubripirellula sp.]|nr:hypothetical protein [Rubripirellula sp.]MDB4654250.1 hypothetical protein [Rubripirellula sp.]
MWAKKCKRWCVAAPCGAGNTLFEIGISYATEVIENAREMAVDEGKQGVTTSLMKKAVKEVSSPAPKPKASTQVDTPETRSSSEPVTGDEAKQCARRALEALAKFKKNAGQLGLLGPQFDKMLNLIEDRLERL